MTYMVVGFPKSGTNLLHRMLAHYLDGPGESLWNGIGKHRYVVKIHWPYQYAEHGNAKVVDIVRDPKDVAVSVYFFYLKFLGSHHDHSRANLPFAEFVRNQFANGFDGYACWPTGWRGNTEYWLSANVSARVLYQKLRNDRERAFRGILEELGVGVEEERLRHAVIASYQFQPQRPSYVDGGMVDAGQSEWKHFFDDGLKEFMWDYAGDLMRKFGYRKD